MNFTKFEPILAALVVADIPLVTGFVNELASQHPSAVTTLIVGAAIVVLNGAAAWARGKVTPTAKLPLVDPPVVVPEVVTPVGSPVVPPQ